MSLTAPERRTVGFRVVKDRRGEGTGESPAESHHLPRVPWLFL